jgi:O-methyltransferase involved in polyketide biosynthesis
MATEKDVSSIADASKPNAGRIYDFLLGGNHNFEVDRQAAQRIVQTIPAMPKAFRLIRWFLREAVTRLADEGFRKFLDFASGLPTVDHIHMSTPKGTRVIYSDIDPVTVSYGREIVKDNPDTRYMVCDATEPETLLEKGVVKEMFGDDRKVAIGYNGIFWFLPDDKIAHAMQVLYKWAAPGSRVYLTTEDIQALSGMNDAEIKQVTETYKKMGQPFYTHSREQLQKLLSPWKLLDPGFRFVEEWVDIKKVTSEEIAKDFKGGGIYGAFFGK